MCLYPKLILNPKYKKNKKNGGIIPPCPDSRTKLVPIGCQQCLECRKQKARNWQVRLMEDIKLHQNGHFITLTFNNESLKELAEYEKTWTNLETGKKYKSKLKEEHTGYELDNQIATVAIRLFLERYRKQYKKSLRHWLVTELGHSNTEHIHLHGIIWTEEPLTTIEKIWNYGFIWKGYKNKRTYVNEKTVNYIIKYINKADLQHKAYKAIILTSAGIGNNYTKNINGDWNKNKYNQDKTIETYRTRQGYKIAMPIYYRNKIYTEQEREKLWIQKLDKNERWVLGNKIDITENQNEYYKALKYAQGINRQLGYGNGMISWEKEKYERERRQLIQQNRYKDKKPSTPGGDTSLDCSADSHLFIQGCRKANTKNQNA